MCHKVDSQTSCSGVNVGFNCATGGVAHDTGVDGGPWDTDGVSEGDDAGGTDGVPEADGAGGTQLQHWHFNFAKTLRFRRFKIMMIVVTLANVSISIKI